MDCLKVNLEIDLDLLVCPLTHEIFFDPVIAQDGQIYERIVIDEWFRNNNTSPITRTNIDPTLTECYTIKNIITTLLKQHPELKEHQYKPDTTYIKNRAVVMQIIYDK